MKCLDIDFMWKSKDFTWFLFRDHVKFTKLGHFTWNHVIMKSCEEAPRGVISTHVFFQESTWAFWQLTSDVLNQSSLLHWVDLGKTLYWKFFTIQGEGQPQEDDDTLGDEKGAAGGEEEEVELVDVRNEIITMSHQLKDLLNVIDIGAFGLRQASQEYTPLTSNR